MYICNFCKQTFERPSTYTEPHGETLGQCPVCGEDDYTEAQKCPECGKFVPEEELHDVICLACQSKALKEFKAFLDGISPEQKEYLNRAYDGKWF